MLSKEPQMPRLIEYPGTAAAAAELLFLSIYVLTVLYAPRNVLTLRFLSLASLVGVSWVLRAALMRLTTVPQWSGTMAFFVGLQLLHASDIMCVIRADPVSYLSAQPAPASGQQGPVFFSDNNAKTTTTTANSPKGCGNRSLPGTGILAAKTIALLCNLRRVGTPWEIKQIVPTQRESRTRFLSRRVLLTLLAYLVVEVILLQPLLAREFFAPGKETLFNLSGQLSIEDVIFRVAATIGMGVTSVLQTWIMINVTHIVMVAVGVSRPEECPTANGSIVEAYTIRKFWG